MTNQTLLDLPPSALDPRDAALLRNYPAKDRPFGHALIAYPHGDGHTISTSQMNNPDPGSRDDFIRRVREEGFTDSLVAMLWRGRRDGVDLIRLDKATDPAGAILPVLDLSTGHVTSVDAGLMEARPAAGNAAGKALEIHPYEYGFTIDATPASDPSEWPAVADALRAEGFSDAFVRLVETASERGASMIRLDQAGEPAEGLDYFDWEQGDLQVDPETGEPPAAGLPSP